MWPPPVIKDPSPPPAAAAAATTAATQAEPKERNYFNETLKVSHLILHPSSFV